MSMVTVALACLLAGNPTGGDTYFINQQQIRIPISVDPARRPEIKEIHLWVSADEGKTWHQQAVATPDQDSFAFFAQKDGMYWFTVVVINQQGEKEPKNIYNAPPSQRIVIDTLKPTLRIRSAERQGDEVQVAWELQEDFPDWTTLRLEYRPVGGLATQWTRVPVTPAPAGQARFRPTIPGPIAVRMHVQDLAESFATAEAEVIAGTVGAMQLASAPAAPVNPTQLTAPPSQPLTTAPMLPEAQPSSAMQRPQTEPAPFTPANTNPTAAATPPRLVASSNPNAQPVPAQPATANTNPARGTPPNMTITNNRQLSLDYQVTKVGPSGIGRVELWATRDDGRTWEKFCENTEPKPPMKVDLPIEGQYGFRLVLHSRAGRSQPMPASGTAPELRLELDTTAPVAQLFRPEPDPKQADALVLTWSATDRNLSPNPITLQWCEKLGQEWQTIIADHPNDGRYVWKLPPSVPYLVYLRLVANDAAGNTSVAETPEAICIDLKEPEGKILGIAGGLNGAARDSAHGAKDGNAIAIPASFNK